MQSAQKIVPDVVSVSDKLSHAIVADCKSGNSIKVDQDERYRLLTPNDLLRHVAFHDKGGLRHAVCYVDTADNHDRLREHTAFPFITFGRDCELHGSFELDDLDKALGRISLAGMKEPTYLYPFSHEDKDYVVIPHVLRGLLGCIFRPPIKDFDISNPDTHMAVLKAIHRYADLISAKHQHDLAEKIRGILKYVMRENREL